MSGAPPLWCPSCREPLVAVVALQLTCPRCLRIYGNLGGVWCTVPEPGFWQSLWRDRLDDYRKRAELELEQLEVAAAREGSSETGRRRMARVRAGLEGQLTALSGHLQVLTRSAPGVPLPVPPAPGALAVIKCYENLFRDWAWGAKEAEQSLALVQRLIANDVGRLAVYGAGAARLAVDLHTTAKPEWTVALDLNPFPLLVAAHLIEGKEVTLPEFPVGPHSEDDVVVWQALRCASDVGSTFSLAFADLLQPPFAPGSLDTVVTSWVIDALDVDLRVTARAIAHVLRPGGTWLNVGPLRFDRNLAEAYSIEEVHEIAGEAGFGLTDSFRERIDYFSSPHSGSSRRETVFGFSARKCRDVPLHGVTGVFPSWLLNPGEPIPSSQGLVALRRSYVLMNGVLSLVDGKRTLKDVAQVLGAKWELPPATLLEPLRVFFARLNLQ